MEPELYYAIGDYLLAHIARHGHARTAEAFGVSRHTLWRFLDRGQPGRALPRAVMAKAGDTPGKLAAATRALRSDGRAAPLERSRTPRLTQALRETLLLLCETPFASVEDLSRIKRVPASSLRERLGKLNRMGLAEAHPHRLAMLSERPLRRHVPTAAGIAALGDDDLLYRHPISRQWLRLLAERLDGVALLYELAAMIADSDPEQDPVRVEHCRSGPYDALVTLSGGRTLGVVRQGAMLSSASLSIAGVTTLAGGTVALVSAVIFSNSLIMIGAVLLLPGLIASGPGAVDTTSGIARRLLRRFSGVEGAMASTNLERSPRRASSTSLAFALGIGLIGFFTVLASTLSAQVADDLDSALQADYIVTSVSTELGTIDPGLVSRLEDLDGVDIASAASQTEGVVDGEPTNIGGIDPEGIGAVVDLGVLEGSLAALGSGGVAVVREGANTDPSLGQELRIQTEGGTITAPVVAVVSTSLGGFDAPSYFVARDTLAALETGLLDTNIYVRASTEAAGNEIRDVVAEMPGALFETRASYLASTGTEVNDFLNFVYAMLGLTVIIALVGVANTTALAMNERIQEIGLLRAIGTTRASIQRMVLIEAALLAALGTVIGLSIALAGAWTLVMVVGSGGPFAVPWLSLGVIAAGGVVAGVLAASYAGWRASRRPALEAIAIA